jgi:NAD-dependent dihydropyrimidine dehydrogenase PreA subunit
MEIATDDVVSSVAIIDPAVCGMCGVCIDRCPAMAITIKVDEQNNDAKSVS